MLWKIAIEKATPVIAFAAEELKRYIGMIDGTQEVIILTFDSYMEGKGTEGALWLRVSEEGTPQVDDRYFDDAFDICIEGSSGHILGVNERSVLFGVYDFLSEYGCAWVRPGKGGEIIPQKKLDNICVHKAEKPSFRHRAVTIEGSVNYDGIIDMIDWLPKVKMNGYFSQMDIPFVFFDRWYSHRGNGTLEPTPLSRIEVKALRDKFVAEIKRRGLIYQTAGHGWTCEPFGLDGGSWDVTSDAVPEETRKYLAEVNGKRDLWGGIAINTNLCYSQEAVRSKIVRAVIDRCRACQDIDIVHLWLADGINNHCECEECIRKRPSDWYIVLLNEIDEAMTAAGLSQKIVLLLYFDLLWPPVEERLVNKDRFILMFAPITRTYSKSYLDEEEFDVKKLPPYVRNRLVFPSSVSENLAWLREWQKVVDCDSFAFDYHYMWDHFMDPGYYQMAEILHEDIRSLKKIGLNGYVSCQNQKVWFPTGLGMTVMAETLWDADTEFESIVQKYFRDTFGEKCEVAREYLASISEACDPIFLRGESKQSTEEHISRISAIENILERYETTVNEMAGSGTLPENNRLSWHYLKYHIQYCRLLRGALLDELRGASFEESFAKLFAWARENELELLPVLDVYELQESFTHRGKVIIY